MLILDRYLLRQFAQIFVICFCSMAGLFVVIDAFGNLDEFMLYASTHGSLAAIMGEYYGYRLLSFFDRTSGILTLIAAMFTMAMFQRYNELTAIQAAGVAKWRIVKPVVLAVVTLAALAVANRELVIPSIRGYIGETVNAQNLGGENGRSFAPRRDYKTDILIRGKQSFINRQRIEKPTFVLPYSLGVEDKQLIADEAFYLPPDGDRPGGYLLKGVTQPKDLATKKSLRLGEDPVVLTPRDCRWLAADECFLVSDVTFEHLAAAADWRQNASLLELIGGLRNPSLGFGSDVRVAVHSRIVQPFLDLTLLFLGLPLVLSQSNRNLFLAIGLCVGVVVVFYLVVLAFQYLGSSYMISPALAAWCPLLLFVPTAVAMSDPLRS